MSEAMNAPNPVPSPAGGSDARPHEPSMEEILASIRRIIADDQSLPGRIRAEEPSPAEPAQVEDAPLAMHALHSEGSSDLDERSPSQAMGEPVAEPQDADENALTAHAPVASPLRPLPEVLAAEPIPAESLPDLSERLEAIHQQAHVHPARRDVAAFSAGGDDYFDPPEEHDRPVAVPADPTPLFSATTNSSVASAFNVLAASRLADNSDELLGMAREMIRPLLRSWLDENLPSMVERLVRDEIERVARGGR